MAMGARAGCLAVGFLDVDCPGMSTQHGRVTAIHVADVHVAICTGDLGCHLLVWDVHTACAGMTPRLSPKKSWEGYWAGVFTGTLYGGFFAFAYSTWGPLHVSIWQGTLLGFVLSVMTILGDLGESLFKRQAGIKDSGNLFPGHGGAFDRIDTWIWAAVIGVYWIRWFLL